MNFEEFDNGTTDLIKRLERRGLFGSVLAFALPAAVSYFFPEMTDADIALLWAVIGTGVIVFAEVRSARIDVLRIERTRLWERYQGQSALDL